jgi:hypothetical protein
MDQLLEALARTDSHAYSYKFSHFISQHLASADEMWHEKICCDVRRLTGSDRCTCLSAPRYAFFATTAKRLIGTAKTAGIDAPADLYDGFLVDEYGKIEPMPRTNA